MNAPSINKTVPSFLPLITFSFTVILRQTIQTARKETRCRTTLIDRQRGFFYMHHPTDRTAHTTAFIKPVVEHWLEREIAQWGSSWGIVPTTHRTMSGRVITHLHLAQCMPRRQLRFVFVIIVLTIGNISMPNVITFTCGWLAIYVVA